MHAGYMKDELGDYIRIRCPADEANGMVRRLISRSGDFAC